MSLGRPHLLLVLAFVGLSIAGAFPVTLSVSELGSLRSSIGQINESIVVARKARALAEQMVMALTDFTEVALDLDASDRSGALPATDAQFATFLDSIVANREAITAWLTNEQNAELIESTKSLLHSWEEIHRSQGTDLTREEKTYHFLKITDSAKTTRRILVEAEARAANEAESQTKNAFARLEFTRGLLIASIAVGFILSIFGIFRIFSSYTKAKESNIELMAANKTMAIANDAMTLAQASLATRTEQLMEAQSLGRLGKWSYRLGEPDFNWAPETYALLGYDPEKFRPSRDAVMSALVGDGARLIMDSQAAVMRGGEVTSVDVRIRRGDGSIGDFMVKIKGLHGADGRIIGFHGTYQDISERKLAEAQLEKLAYYDSLTGLPNRALFQRELNDTLTNCKRTGTDGALLLLDLDRFKEVNDTLGHAAGDELLGKVSHLITRVLGPDQFIARLGGDEFAVILTKAGEATAEDTASAIIAAVCSSISLSRGEVVIGTSIGIAKIPHDGATTVELLRNADLALYRAKEDGRGRFALFHHDLNEAVQHKAALARDLRRAVQVGGELSVHYQPQIELSTGRVTGLETLMRWTHPTRGNVPPSEFISIAESSNLICELGSWILREAAFQGRAWLDAGEPPREIAVNVSAAQIWHSNLVEDVKRVLEETGLPPHLLCLELTESILVNRLDGRVGIVLNTLKSLGVTLALDDFGTDYSSLGYLIGLPFDKLKIDRIFIDGVAESSRAQKLLEGIIALGRGLGMKTIAEGAEIPREVEILRGFGCDTVQGFVFARPAAAIEALANVHALELNGPGKFRASLPTTDAAAISAAVKLSTSVAARSLRQSA